MRLDRCANALGDFQSLVARADDESQIFFAAIASRAVGAADNLADDVAAVAYGVAADQMAAPVVDALEEIQIHHQDTEGLRAGAARFLSDATVEVGEQAAARAQAGQFVALRHLVQLLLELGLE